MELRIGDRLVDETGESEVVGRPYPTAGGKTAHVRVQRASDPSVTAIRTWGAHERVAVRQRNVQAVMTILYESVPELRTRLV